MGSAEYGGFCLSGLHHRSQARMLAYPSLKTGSLSLNPHFGMIIVDYVE
jgi:hypothetical protein